MGILLDGHGLSKMLSAFNSGWANMGRDHSQRLEICLTGSRLTAIHVQSEWLILRGMISLVMICSLIPTRTSCSSESTFVLWPESHNDFMSVS